MFDIREHLKLLPDKPGVYLYKDKFDQIIYVGKALSLKNRVRQYFHASAKLNPKVKALVENIDEFEYIVTNSEVEALILENNLIKKNQPKYNVLLRDDKTYPYIKITLNEKFPRIIKTRKVYHDGGKYFGPYTDVGAVNLIIELLNTVYPIKKCSTQRFSANFKPCLNYHIGLCLGVCTQQYQGIEYPQYIQDSIAFLQGKDASLLKTLNEKMNRASEELNFEKAAEYRDYILSYEALKEKQKMIMQNTTQMDVIVAKSSLKGTYVMIFYLRDGKLTGRESFPMESTKEDQQGDVIAAFIKQYYSHKALIPKEIILPSLSEESGVIESWLSEERGSQVKLVVPQKGEKKSMLTMAEENIAQMLMVLDERAKNQAEKSQGIHGFISEILGINNTIRRIESYDISNISGVDSVGAMVVFEDGKAKKKDYRKFKIKTIEGANDYGSLQEVMYRRFKRYDQKGNDSFSQMPDLLLIDGGEKQVSAVEDVLKAMEISVPAVGMVKDHKHKTRALVYQGREIQIKSNQELFAFISFVQEEVHRFAIEYHRNLRGKAITKSLLDQIDGIGEKRKAALFIHFGTMERIREASVEQLLAVDGMNQSVAEEVYHFLQGNPIAQK